MTEQAVADTLGTDSKSEYEKALEEVEQLRSQPCSLATYAELEALEQEIEARTRKVRSELLKQKLQEAVKSEAFRAQEAEWVRGLPGRFVSEGYREVTIRCASGEEIRIELRYFSGKRRWSKGKRKGVYPGLFLLGITEGCTPHLGSQIGALVAAVGSLAEACEALARWGVRLGVNTVRALAYGWAERARALQQHAGQVEYAGDLGGRCVVVGTDGGRIRLRKNKPGPGTPKGRRRYRTDWKEPKLLIIYVVDAEGRRSQQFAPIIDSTLSGPTALTALLCHYLSRLQVHQADKLLFVADAAAWIWKRVAWVTELLGLAADRVYQLIDFYHAVGHLGKAAAACASFSESERKRWLHRQRKHLLNGKIAQVIEAVATLSRRRPKVRKELNYFLRHQARMQYAVVRDAGLPIGSGAVESAVRRVINLRLKGASIYWLEENAESMLMLRSFYKSGRWNVFKNMALSPLAACFE